MRKHILWGLVLACLLVVAGAPAMAGPLDSAALVPQLTMDKAALTTADSVNIRFSLANHRVRTIYGADPLDPSPCVAAWRSCFPRPVAKIRLCFGVYPTRQWR